MTLLSGVLRSLIGDGLRMRVLATSGKRGVSGLLAIAACAAIAATGCHSFHIEATVENRTGVAIKELEVDYPSASFGTNMMAPGGDFHYRIQLRGDGPIKVQYTGPDERQVQISGPTMAERQEGGLEIVLLPGGKAEFHPHLKH